MTHDTEKTLVRGEPLGGNETIAELCQKVIDQFTNEGITFSVFEAGLALNDKAGDVAGLFKVRFEIVVEPVQNFKGILPASRH